MLIDTHCHFDAEQYNNSDEFIQLARKHKLNKIIISGYDAKSSELAILLAHKYKEVYATVGFHPHCCKEINGDIYSKFEQWLTNDKVVGVGEIGLDYFYDLDWKGQQKELFIKQIEIAIKYQKPIVVHNRDASEEVYNILKNYDTTGIIHCFNDNADMANKFIEMGFLLGVGGIVTFKNNKLKDVIKTIPLKYIVLETDSPYLSPEPFRGKSNHPKNLQFVVNTIAEIKNLEYDKVASVTSLNAERIFDFEEDLC